MQFCQSHWNQLRQQVKDKGMFHLVSTSGEQAVNRIKKEFDGQSSVPDPLMEAHNMILERSIKYLGLYLMGMKEDDTQYCPLCEANKHLPPNPETNLVCADSWIITLVDYLEKEYQKEGWLNKN